jgi:hypothetical protein
LTKVLDQEERPIQTPRASKQEQAKEVVSLEHGADDEDNAKITARSKAKRRFVAIEDDEAGVARQTDVDDSFTKTAKKRGRPRKEDNTAQAPIKIAKKTAKARALRKVEEDAPNASHHVQVAESAMSRSVRRPRRQAAASAMVKVTEGFIEEAAPIDKKRRDPEPEKTVKHGRKKATPVGVSILVSEDPVELVAPVAILTVRATEKAIVKIDACRTERTESRKPNRRSRKQVEEVPRPAESVTDIGTRDDAAITQCVAPAITEGREKSRKPAAISQSGSSAQRKEDAEPEVGQVHLEPKPTKQRSKDSPTVKRISTAQTLKRNPLGETHANTTMRSVSPEKTIKSPNKDDIGSRKYVAQPKPTRSSTSVSMSLLATSQKNSEVRNALADRDTSLDVMDEKSGRKIKVLSDDDPGDDRFEHDPKADSNSVKQTRPAKGRKPANPKLSTKPPPKDGDERVEVVSLERPSVTSGERPSAATTKLDNAEIPKGRLGAKPSATSKGEEDIDWLFTAPGDDAIPSRAPKPKPKRSKAPVKAMSSWDKMAAMDDMDLDDVLSNIANFAGFAAKGKCQSAAWRG